MNKKILDKKKEENTETPFMDYVKDTKKHNLQQLEKEIEVEEEFEKILPEESVTIEEKSREADDFEVSYKTPEEYVSLKQPRMVETRTKLKRNPNLHTIANLRHHGRIYFDKRDCEDYLYIFHSKKPIPKARIKLDKAILYTLLAYCIAEIYGERLLNLKYPEIWITKRLKKKISEILTQRELTYAFII